MEHSEQNILDKALVLHYILYGNKTNAFLYARGHLTNAQRVSIPRMAVAYFDKDNIKALLSFESENVKQSLNSIFERVGMKNPTSQNDNNSDRLNDNNTDILNKDLTKSELITIIGRKLAGNPSEDTIKALGPLMAKLQAWDKEKVTQNSNITFYELPKKIK